MNRTTLLYVCALAGLVGLAPNVGAQSNVPGDSPVTTSYRDYRLEAIHLSPDGDPAAVSIPAATAVPEPKSWALLMFGGAIVALAGVRGSALRSRRLRN